MSSWNSCGISLPKYLLVKHCKYFLAELHLSTWQLENEAMSWSSTPFYDIASLHIVPFYQFVIGLNTAFLIDFKINRKLPN